jgi:hypothetical protein
MSNPCNHIEDYFMQNNAFKNKVKKVKIQDPIDKINVFFGALHVSLWTMSTAWLHCSSKNIRKLNLQPFMNKRNYYKFT